MIGKDHPGDREIFGERDLKGITLGPLRHGTDNGKPGFIVVSSRREGNCWPASRLLPPRLGVEI